MFLKNLPIFALLLLTGCGFTPMNMTDNGTNISAETEKIAIGSIPNYEGFLLKTELQNKLNPEKNDVPKEYALHIALKAPSYSEQSIQGDNFASRENVTISARFTLKDIKTNTVLLSDSTRASGAYNIVKEPYATNMARNKLKNDLIKRAADNIALRVTSFLKTQKDANESQTDSN